MKNVLLAGAAFAAALVLATAAAAVAKPAVHAATVATARTGMARITVAGRGRSLYLFEKDSRSRSACSGLCATYWPPLLTSGKPVAIKGAKPSLLGSIR